MFRCIRQCAAQAGKNSESNPQARLKATLRLVIHGLVQGVFFHDSMRREAQRLAVTGRVSDCTDGTAEAVVQGETSAVDAIVRWVLHVPEFAQVVKIDSGPDDGVYTGFEIP